MKHFFLLLFTTVAMNAKSAKLAVFSSALSRIAADTDTVFRKSSVSVGANYGSDVQFFGRTGPVSYPFVSTDVVYNTKSGWFVYGSAVKVLGYNAPVDEVDVGGGYFYRYSKAFSGSLSYNRFIFNENSAEVIKSASSNDVNWKNSFDWKIAKSSIVFDYLFGDVNDYFVTLNTSKYIETSFGVFDDKDYFSINPGVSVIFGTQNFVGKYSSQHPDKLDLDNYYIKVSMEGPQPFPTYNNGRFNALNYSFKLPIAYNRPHYTLEASWKYSIPVNVEGILKNKRELFFNLTFYYLFF